VLDSAKEDQKTEHTVSVHSEMEFDGRPRTGSTGKSREMLAPYGRRGDTYIEDALESVRAFHAQESLSGRSAITPSVRSHLDGRLDIARNSRSIPDCSSGDSDVCIAAAAFDVRDELLQRLLGDWVSPFGTH